MKQTEELGDVKVVEGEEAVVDLDAEAGKEEGSAQ